MANVTTKRKLACIALFSVMGTCLPTEGTNIPMKDREKCKYWQGQVDPSIKLLRDPTEVSNPNEDNPLEAIECLLKLKGRSSPSTFSSATVGYDLSQRFPPPTIEVAALYYASYLYHQNWHHAKAIILMDKEGKKNTKKSIQIAYERYQSWFEKVKGIGLEKAREQRLDPLNGMEVCWY